MVRAVDEIAQINLPYRQLSASVAVRGASKSGNLANCKSAIRQNSILRRFVNGLARWWPARVVQESCSRPCGGDAAGLFSVPVQTEKDPNMKLIDRQQEQEHSKDNLAHLVR